MGEGRCENKLRAVNCTLTGQARARAGAARGTGQHRTLATIECLCGRFNLVKIDAKASTILCSISYVYMIKVALH